MQAAPIPPKFNQIPAVWGILSLAAVVVGAIISLLVVETDYELFLLAGIIGGVSVIILFLKPEWSLYILVFMLYTRISDVLVNFHGAPSIAKFYIPLLLLLVVGRWLIFQDKPQGLSQLGIIIVFGLIGFVSLLYAPDLSRVAP